MSFHVALGFALSSELLGYDTDPEGLRFEAASLAPSGLHNPRTLPARAGLSQPILGLSLFGRAFPTLVGRGGSALAVRLPSAFPQ